MGKWKFQNKSDTCTLLTDRKKQNQRYRAWLLKAISLDRINCFMFQNSYSQFTQ